MLPKTRPESPVSLRPRRFSGEQPRVAPSVPPPFLDGVPKLWLAQLGQQLLLNDEDQDTGVLAIHLANVPAAVLEHGSFVGHRAMTAAHDIVAEAVRSNGGSTRYRSYDLLAFLGSTRHNSVLTEVERILDRLGNLTFRSGERTFGPKPIVGFVRFAEDTTHDKHRLVMRSLERLERAKTLGRMSCFTDA
ncbi:MAG TPA: hypothetical protein VF407_21585 [Polyangiaceae bacterium]